MKNLTEQKDGFIESINNPFHKHFWDFFPASPIYQSHRAYPKNRHSLVAMDSQLYWRTNNWVRYISTFEGVVSI